MRFYAYNFMWRRWVKISIWKVIKLSLKSQTVIRIEIGYEIPHITLSQELGDKDEGEYLL